MSRIVENNLIRDCTYGPKGYNNQKIVIEPFVSKLFSKYYILYTVLRRAIEIAPMWITFESNFEKFLE